MQQRRLAAALRAFEEAQCTWLEKNPAFGLVVFPDLILPERDVDLLPIGVLGPVAGRVSSVMPPPASAPVVGVRAGTVMTGGPSSINGQPPLPTPTVEERSVVGRKAVVMGSTPSSSMKPLEERGGALELMGFEEVAARKDVDVDEAGLVSAKGPRAKRRRVEDDEAESEGDDGSKAAEIRKVKGKGKQTVVKKGKVSYMHIVGKHIGTNYLFYRYLGEKRSCRQEPCDRDRAARDEAHRGELPLVLARRWAVPVLPPGDQGARPWSAVRDHRGSLRGGRHPVGCLSVLPEGAEGLLVPRRVFVILGEEALVGGGGVGRRGSEESCA